MLDLYPIVRPLLFRLDPEVAHHLVVMALKKRLGPKIKKQDQSSKTRGGAKAKPMGATDPILKTKVCGLVFDNPIGLAAGFDKQCEVMSEVMAFGFGFVEVGTITPQPQAGNPKPRMFRIPEVQGAINRFGFNSDGMDVCSRRISAWRDENAHNRPGLLGINIGKNKDTTDAIVDYVAGIKTFAPNADYLTINISSPNTPGLRELQGREELTELLSKAIKTRDAAVRKPPIFVKIAPDLTPGQEIDIAAVALASGVDGVIIGNTTVERPGAIPMDMAKEAGGFSGPALFAPSTKVLGNIYRLTEGKIPLIGCGGIFSAPDAYAKIRAGASLLQLYTALIYEGPGLVRRIASELAALLHRDGFASISEAVGADHR